MSTHDQGHARPHRAKPGPTPRGGKRYNIRLDDEMDEAARAGAAAEGISISDFLATRLAIVLGTPPPAWLTSKETNPLRIAA